MDKESVGRNLEQMRERAPLVHNITNYVVMNTTANALLAVGASPVMAHAVGEVEEMVSIASALVLNIGTLSRPWIDAMLKAGGRAREGNIPVVFDPVGAGATRLRTDTSKRIIDEVGPTVIRGNPSEILALLQADAKTRGVDSLASSDEALDVAEALATEHGCVVSVSGATDYITDGTVTIAVSNGDPMLAKVTGMGCTASALTGAFIGSNENAREAAASAMVIMGMAGERAAWNTDGPGSFQVAFLDALHRIDRKAVRADARIESR